MFFAVIVEELFVIDKVLVFIPHPSIDTVHVANALEQFFITLLRVSRILRIRGARFS